MAQLEEVIEGRLMKALFTKVCKELNKKGYTLKNDNTLKD